VVINDTDKYSIQNYTAIAFIENKLFIIPEQTILVIRNLHALVSGIFFRVVYMWKKVKPFIFKPIYPVLPIWSQYFNIGS
jgi:hypothetical protein